MVSYYSVNMSDDFETQFKADLYSKFETLPKYLIPRDTYNSTIEQLKTASQTSSTKSRQDYYILQK